MKNYKLNNRYLKLWACMAILLVGAFGLQAQQDRYNWRFGLGVGNQYSFGSPYNVDSIASTGIVELDPAFFSYSAFLELSLSKSFGLKVFTSTRPQDYIVSNSGLLLSYYFDNDYLFGSKAIIAPYLSLGAAYGENQNSFNVPFGGGLKVRLSRRVNVNIDFTARSYTYRWNESNFNFGNELGGYSSVSVHYNFGKKPTAYNAPRPYVSPYAQSQATTQKVKPALPVVVEKEIVIVKTSTDTTAKKVSERVVIDTNITVRVDSIGFMSEPKDSTVKVEFLNRYGNILKAPKLGDSTRSYNVEAESAYDKFNVLPPAVKVDSSSQSATAVVISKTSNPGKVESASVVYPARDSTLAELEFEIRRQTLKNELRLLRKAENDSTLKALRQENELLKSQVQAGAENNGVIQNVEQPESQPSNEATSGTTQSTTYTPSSTGGAGQTYSGSGYESTFRATGVTGAALVGGAAVGGSENAKVERLEAKVDTLQMQLINLQKILLAQNLKPAMVVEAKTDTAFTDTMADVALDSLVADTLAADTLVVDTVAISPTRLIEDSTSVVPLLIDTVKKVEYVTEKELKTLKEDLAKTQQEVDSLIKVKPPVLAKPSAPEKEVVPVKKTIFETTGKAEVFFDIGSSSLNAASRKKLDDMIEYAKNRPEANFLLKGFTDKTGSLAINKALSDKRAKAVEQYITSKGIDTGRLKVMSIGPDQSLTDGSQSYGRRVEVILN